MRSRKNRRHFLDIWPGFVDALATLLMALIFVLMVFVISQGYMGEIIHGRDKSLKELNQKFDQLSNLLGIEKIKSEDLKKILYTTKSNLEESELKKNQYEENIKNMKSYLTEVETSKKTQEIQIEEFTKQINMLNDHLTRISSNLTVSKEENDKKDNEIKGLLQKLKAIEKLNKDFDLAKYRSEFFGKLKEAIGERNDISIRGDRFIFQSEVLFKTGSWELEEDGQKQLEHLASTLKEITSTFPKGINWILRIDGHTDKRPIKNEQVASNWELSSKRAIAVVIFLISRGISANKLAATGFGEFQPIDTGVTEQAYNKNRRIEIKLDQF